MKLTLKLFAVLIITCSTQQAVAQFAVSVQGNAKFLLEELVDEPFIGGGIRGEWYPYGNVGVTAGFNYYNSISYDSFSRLEKARNDVSPNFFNADLTTFIDRYSFEANARLYPFLMEYDDRIGAYGLFGFSVDYLSVSNDVGKYNATDYRFENNPNGTSSKPVDNETMIGLFFNGGAGIHYDFDIVTVFAEAYYSLVGSQFKAEDKQYQLKRNVNTSFGVRYHFRRR